MESFNDQSDDFSQCCKCNRRTWIYILKKEVEKETKYYYCNAHYIEKLKLFLDDGLEEDIIIFPEALHLEEVPIQAARMQYGETIPEKYILQAFLDHIKEKLEKIEEELKSVKENEDNTSLNQPFLNMIMKDKEEKELMKYLILAKIRKNNSSGP
ncbi:MAG: hypothetical protein GY870_15585 [archaeon]|nr:hypothetical protein [archaeon]